MIDRAATLKLLKDIAESKHQLRAVPFAADAR
jgi:hypothetical protein